MNTHGAWRLASALLLLAIAIGSALVCLSIAGLLDPSSVVSDWPGVQALLTQVDSLDGTERLAVGAGSVVVGILSLALLVRSTRGSKAATSLHMLDIDDLGFVVVNSRGIAAVAGQAAASAHGVIDAHIEVEGTGTSPVKLRADIGVFPGADLKRAGTEARANVHDAVSRLVGIEIRDVTVAVHVLEADDLARRLE